MSDSSSEDEDLELLRESIDFQFVSDSLYTKKAPASSSINLNGKCGPKCRPISVPLKKKCHTELPPSLRRSRDDSEQFNQLGVSPEFQKYVAKHVTKLLDAYLEKHLNFDFRSDTVKSNACGNGKKGGVRLFSCSKKLMRDCNKPEDNKIIAEGQPKEDTFKNLDIKKWASKMLASRHKAPKIEDSTPQQSLRKPHEAEEEFNTKKLLKIQEMLHKWLDEYFERRVKFINVKTEQDKIEKQSEQGIDLFKDFSLSSNLVQDSASDVNSRRATVNRTKVRKRKIDDETSEDEREKARSVAVSGNYVLSQEDTKCWTYKNRVFKYVRTESGVFEAVD